MDAQEGLLVSKCAASAHYISGINAHRVRTIFWLILKDALFCACQNVTRLRGADIAATSIMSGSSPFTRASAVKGGQSLTGSQPPAFSDQDSLTSLEAVLADPDIRPPGRFDFGDQHCHQQLARSLRLLRHLRLQHNCLSPFEPPPYALPRSQHQPPAFYPPRPEHHGIHCVLVVRLFSPH